MPSEQSKTPHDPRSAVGARIGAYELAELIGQGGMGVVYRARDVRLERDVAIKAISRSAESDQSRVARLLREARVLASLSHPNIAKVYGLEEADSARFVVMELMPGPTLSQKLSRGAISLKQTLAVGLQVAAGLEAAHNAGIVHRDLKPGNVMFAADGSVKVLDFGLACESRPVGPDAPTKADSLTHVTADGTVIGTPGYMSPEQLRGEPVDRRADVFAFGCVLFECLTGKRAFEGPSVAQTVAAVLEREPDLSALPPHTPESVRRLLRRCLAKDPRRRLRDLGDAVIELEDAAAAPTPPTSPQPRASKLWLAAACAGTVLLAAGAIALLTARRNSGSASGPMERFSIAYPGPQSAPAYLRVCLSRDGSKLVAAANDGQQQYLWLRQRGESGLQRMDGTEGGRLPTLSPDAQWLTFFCDGVMMKRRTSGGQSYRICTSFGWWGSSWWGTDGVITFLPNWGMGLARISAEGGSPEFVTQLKPDLNEFAQLSPFVLPDNRRVLVTVWDGKQGLKIVAINLETQQRHTVVENASTPRVAETPFGTYLLWCRASTIYAAPFDMDRASVTGPPTPIVDGVMTDVVLFVAVYDVADDGTLAYVPGAPFIEQSRLAWLGPDETTTPYSQDHMGFGDPQFSADGSRLLTIVKGEQYRPYLHDQARGTFSPVVTDADVESAALSPDGQKIVYTSNREGPYKLFLRNLSDNRDEKLYEGPGDYQTSLQWSRDGRYITFSMSPADAVLHDVWYMKLGDRQLRPFVSTPGEDRAPKISPDSRWLAYSSDVSGVREIYIRSFPDGKATKQVTTEGGDVPDWSPDGSLVYFRNKGILYGVSISPDGTPAAKPAIVYARRFGQADYHMTDYAISPRGRILLIEPSEHGPTVQHVNMILNWHELVAPSRASGR
jgi:hypothetical protein